MLFTIALVQTSMAKLPRANLPRSAKRRWISLNQQLERTAINLFKLRRPSFDLKLAHKNAAKTKMKTPAFAHRGQKYLVQDILRFSPVAPRVQTGPWQFLKSNQTPTRDSCLRASYQSASSTRFQSPSLS